MNNNTLRQSKPDSPETNEQLLNDIQSLQTMEQELFNNLQNNPSLTTDQKNKIVEKMNQLSNMRINLYRTLGGLNNYYKNSLQTSQGTLKEQTSAIYIVENELNKAKKRLAFLDTEKNNKIRLVEINNYYGDKYAEHGNLMKIIIFTLVPVIILAILNSKGLLPNIIYFILICIIAAVGGYFFWMRFTSIVTRDNMNYQAYDWYFDASKAPGPASGEISSDPWASNSSGSCFNEACCSTGQIYDITLNKCIINPNPSSSTTGTSSSTTGTSPSTTRTSPSTNTNEDLTLSMINSIFTKGSNKYKGDVALGNNVAPNLSNSLINI